MSPTYELAIQTGEVVAKMGKFCQDIRIRYAVRGEDRNYISLSLLHFHICYYSCMLNFCDLFPVPRGSKLNEHIVIGTPGKVLDWSIKFKFFDLSKITVFVLDEADVMIATQGHQDQSFRIRRYESLEEIVFKSTCFFSFLRKQQYRRHISYVVLGLGRLIFFSN